MKDSILIKGGWLVDPASGFEGTADLLAAEGRVALVGEIDEAECTPSRIIDARGLTVMPGLVDLHVHLRDPGQTEKETIESGAAAAAAGGITTLLAMPNTRPPMDSVSRISYVANKAAALSPVRIYQASAITLDMKGTEVADIEALTRSGVRAFSEDGKSVMDARTMFEAMKRIARTGALICDHCEDAGMAAGGVMNEDARAEELGLPGIANAVEDTIAARDIVLAAESGARLHLCHCSTAGSVRLVRAAKREGIRVTAEACPHHFILTSDDIPGDDANYKMNPPLRTARDVKAIRDGLKDGTIDCISTDHAPHCAEEKRRGFRSAPFGIVGLETSAALTYTELVKTGVLSLMQMAEKMSLNPARILGVPGGSLQAGMPADIAVFDFRTPVVIDPSTFASKGRNTPFAGRTVFGTLKYTLVNGQVVREAGHD